MSDEEVVRRGLLCCQSIELTDEAMPQHEERLEAALEALSRILSERDSLLEAQQQTDERLEQVEAERDSLRPALVAADALVEDFRQQMQDARTERDSLRAALEESEDRYEVVRERVVGLLNDFMRQANDGITALTSSEKEKA